MRKRQIAKTSESLDKVRWKNECKIEQTKLKRYRNRRKKEQQKIERSYPPMQESRNVESKQFKFIEKYGQVQFYLKQLNVRSIIYFITYRNDSS